MHETPRRENDASYRNLFNHASMIQWLLSRYVAQPWVGELDFTTLEPVKAHFVGAENQKRESDLIWRARLKQSDDWFYVFVLVEFQSTVDRFMALRVLTYICLLYEDLIRQKALTQNDKLPPVMPIVLYNGDRPWTMPLQLHELIEAVTGGLENHVPRFEYILLDEAHLPPESLQPLDNPVTAVFQLEQAESLHDLRRVVTELVHLLEGPDMTGPRRDMVTWLRRVILPVAFPGESFPELQGLKETEDMLAERVKRWPEQWMAQGRQEGLEQGRSEGLQRGLVQGRTEGLVQGRTEGLVQGRTEGLVQGRTEGLVQGRTEGLRTAIMLQLEMKFGELGPGYSDRLQAATLDELQRWATRLLDASSVDEVFRPT